MDLSLLKLRAFENNKKVNKEITKRLSKAKKLVKINDTITILENNMDLSLLKLRAFEINKKVNEEINIKFLLRV